MADEGRSRMPDRDLGYVVLSGQDLIAFMHRAAVGESPDLLFVEFAANSDTESVEPEACEHGADEPCPKLSRDDGARRCREAIKAIRGIARLDVREGRLTDPYRLLHLLDRLGL